MNATLAEPKPEVAKTSSHDAKAPVKHRKRVSPRAAFIGAVVVPTLVTLFYLLVCAAPTYQADIRLVVRENTENGGALPGLAATLLGARTHISIEDSHILATYLHGSRFIDLADQRLGLKAHYQSPWLDPVHRLERNPLAEEFYAYVAKRLVIAIATDSNIVTVQVQAFTPEMAKALADLVVEESEKAINLLNARMSESRTTLAQKELAHRQANLLAKRGELLRFQGEQGMLNPSTEAGSHLTRLAALDARRVEKETELRTKQQYLQTDSFELKRLRQELQALDEQRRQETGSLVAPGDKNMASTLQAYENLKMEADFARQAYASAFALVESAHLEAGRQEKFLLLINPPHLPQEPVFPRPFVGALVVLVTALVLFGIGRLVVATIRDHSI